LAPTSSSPKPSAPERAAISASARFATFALKAPHRPRSEVTIRKSTRRTGSRTASSGCAASSGLAASSATVSRIRLA